MVCLSLSKFSFLLFFFSSSVSPELLGVLSSIAAFMVLMAVFFLYLSNKLSVESPDDLSHLGGYKSNQPGTRHTYRFTTSKENKQIIPRCVGEVHTSVSTMNSCVHLVPFIKSIQA